MLCQIVTIEILATGVCKLQRAGIVAIDVAKIGGVGKDMCFVERTIGRLQLTVGRQSEGHQEEDGQQLAFRQSEEKA